MKSNRSQSIAARVKDLLIVQDSNYFINKGTASATQSFRVRRRLTLIANVEKKSLFQVESEIRRQIK